MKILFSVILLTILTNVNAQWVQLSSGTATDLSSVHFADAQTGWIAGDDGKILKTTNGGTSWVAQSSGTAKDLNSIFFADAAHGWAAGKDGVIRHTSDGGLNWSAQTSGTAFDLNAIHFFDLQNGLAVGETGVILKTVNGGASWSISVAGNGGSGSGSDESDLELTDVQMISASVAYVCGTSGYFAKTTNHGASWTVQPTNVSEDFASLHFPAAAKGYIAYEAGKVKATNGNGTFTSVYAATSKDLNGMWFINELRGWVCGDEGRLLFTANGGTSWSSHNLPAVTEDLYSIHFPTPEIGYAVGKNGTILKLSNGQQLGLAENQSAGSVTAAPNPATESTTLYFGKPGERTITISNINGQQVAMFDCSQETIEIPTSGWQPGIYYVSTRTAEGVATLKLIRL